MILSPLAWSLPPARPWPAPRSSQTQALQAHRAICVAPLPLTRRQDTDEHVFDDGDSAISSVSALVFARVLYPPALTPAAPSASYRHDVAQR
jgi:hypothetical protein